MATTITSGAGLAAGAHGSHGLMRRVYDRMVAGREREARRYVNGYLATLDDAALAELGYDRKSLDASGPALFPY